MRCPSESWRTGVRKKLAISRISMNSLRLRRYCVLRDAVDRAQELERFDEREIPIKLTALSEDHADVSSVFLAVFPRHEAGNAHFARGRNEDPRQHLDGRRLAGTVRADVADQLSRFERERDVAHRDALFVFAREKGTQRAEGPRRALAGAKDFAQIARCYDRQDTSVRHSVFLFR